MKLHNLKPAKGSTNTFKRLGRGEGSGKGGSSTRGTKGAKSRSGFRLNPGFEGGQMPLQRRIPKFGFTNPNRVEFSPVNVADLQTLAETLELGTITSAMMIEAGLASGKNPVKVLGGGELTAKLEVTADAFSKSAIEKIEAAGGKAITEE